MGEKQHARLRSSRRSQKAGRKNHGPAEREKLLEPRDGAKRPRRHSDVLYVDHFDQRGGSRQ